MTLASELSFQALECDSFEHWVLESIKQATCPLCRRGQITNSVWSQFPHPWSGNDVAPAHKIPVRCERDSMQSAGYVLLHEGWLFLEATSAHGQPGRLSGLAALLSQLPP